MQETENVGERKTVLLAERDVQSVVGGGSLEFKVEGTAKTFAESEPPGFVDACSEGRVDDELHAAAFVEEALGDDRCLRGDRTEQRAAGQNVFDGLFGAGVVQSAFVLQPAHGLRYGLSGLSGGIQRTTWNQRADPFSQRRNMRGE